MISDRKLPDASTLVEYSYAVAGHDGTMTDEGNSMFFKPCTQKEIDFYESANRDHKAFADIMPTLCGVLQVADPSLQAMVGQLPSGTSTPEQIAELAQQSGPNAKAEAPKEVDNETWVPKGNKKIAVDTVIALENATDGYTKPNILDAKLGVRLYADYAPKQKKQRFDEISRTTTHKDYGFRIAGMRVYRGAEDRAEWDEKEYKVYDRDYGRTQVTNDSLVDTIRSFIFNPAAGIDDELGRWVADAFLKDLKHIQKVLENEESRMYSSSLLFVFEGDGDALRAAISESEQASRVASTRETSVVDGGDTSDFEAMVQAGTLQVLPPSDGQVKAAACLGRSNARVDSGIVLDDDGELILTGEGDIKEFLREGDEISFDDESSQARIATYGVKLIDFAHAKWVPGEGPDENCLKGVRSLVKIFEELAGK